LKNKFTLPFKNKISEIARLHQVVEEYFFKHMIPTNIQASVNLALEELLVNTITYGFADDQEHDITITFGMKDNMLITEIEDDGIAFNPLKASDPDLESSLEEKEIGGLGIHMVKTLMDNVEYRRNNDKNLIILKKSIG
jgi:anti-sigma regulatory factor (Ser/Thr protein kinase)